MGFEATMAIIPYFQLDAVLIVPEKSKQRPTSVFDQEIANLDSNETVKIISFQESIDSSSSEVASSSPICSQLSQKLQ
ncbi:hypothetical protein AVEN_39626-1 [Araneus ventricosus]|uniref:Uncharacterized protein n=1 Tax=Araneus ventricosus TaxID=182803 RepID=A0A4Y2NVM2_ARAVE|nr:hypothetical protein AVEN_39626-1 [Araneus ventricosus]